MGDVERDLGQQTGASLRDRAGGPTDLSHSSVPQPKALIPSAVAGIILDHLDQRQRDFILKMKPHRRSQIMSKSDWRDVEPCVDLEGPVYPCTYWFGGMRTNWLGGRPRRTFMFNEVGLEVRAVLASAMSASGQDPQGLEAKPASAVANGETPKDQDHDQ